MRPAQKAPENKPDFRASAGPNAATSMRPAQKAPENADAAIEWAQGIDPTSMRPAQKAPENDLGVIDELGLFDELQ